MIILHESMVPGRDQTRDPWICSQTRICSQTHYRLRYAAQCLLRVGLTLNVWSVTHIFGKWVRVCDVILMPKRNIVKNHQKFYGLKSMQKNQNQKVRPSVSRQASWYHFFLTTADTHGRFICCITFQSILSFTQYIKIWSFYYIHVSCEVIFIKFY